jgi:hypothetical protein
MKRTLKRGLSVLFALAIALGASSLIPQKANAGGDKWCVCHYPPGNPRNLPIIAVGSHQAAMAPRAHGDFVLQHHSAHKRYVSSLFPLIALGISRSGDLAHARQSSISGSARH